MASVPEAACLKRTYYGTDGPFAMFASHFELLAPSWFRHDCGAGNRVADAFIVDGQSGCAAHRGWLLSNGPR